MVVQVTSSTGVNTAVCIAGAHRSGTSMLAELLEACGLYLGPESQLMPPARDNVKGFREHLGFVKLNDKVLGAFGGSWDLPPEMTFDSGACSGLQPLEEEARRLIEPLASAPHWGWKDPRNSLTLPFWRRLIHGLKIVAIVRHPLEVAGSLQKRNGVSRIFAFNLWAIYNQRLLASADNDLIFTHYDSFFDDAEGELTRILTHLEFPVSKARNAAVSVSAAGRHHYATKRRVAAAKLPREILELYETLIARTSRSRASRFASVPAPSARALRRSDGEVIARRTSVKDLQAQLAQRTAWAEAADDQKERALAALKSLQRQFDERTAWAKEVDAELAKTRELLTDLQAQVAERTAWAKAADGAKEKACADLVKLQQEFAERTAWALQLETERDEARARLSELQAESQAALHRSGSTVET
ncbi:MAG: sulfotransferase [Chthoniobacterales bacterium]